MNTTKQNRRVNKWFIIAGVFAGLLFFMVGKTSAAGVERIKRFEALRLSPYKDIAGKWTIGYGHLIRKYEPELMAGITQQKADALLRGDLRLAEGTVRRLVTVKLNTNQFDALTSLIFNIGPGAFARSTLLKLINLGDFTGAAAQFPRWANAGGKQSAGLMARRATEQNTFMS